MFYLNRIRSLSSYSGSMFKDDVLSGLTVSLISLPLAMAFAIAIGVSPQYGLFAAIISGGIQAIFGGSETNISGPAGAFIGVLTAFTASGHDFNDVLIVGVLAGAILIVASLLRVGKFVQYVPYPVIVGFTGGIGIIIFKTQIGPATGLDLASVTDIFGRLGEIHWLTFGITFLTIVIIEVFSKLTPKLPNTLLGIIFSSVVVSVFGMNLETVQSKYGAIPRSLPTIELPSFAGIDWSIFLPVALSIAGLAALESLLSATASDKMTGKMHDPNTELLGCGLANIIGPFFSGIPVCGAIARTTLNARSGSHSWIAALFNAVFLLLMVLSLGPLVGKIPLAALAGVLVGISLKLIDVKLYMKLLKSFHIADFAMVMATLLLTIFVSLTMGILLGLGIAVAVYFSRFYSFGANQLETSSSTAKMNLNGSIFFGNARKTTLDLSGTKAEKIEIQFSENTLFDSTGIEALKDIKALNPGTPVILKGTSTKLKEAIETLGGKGSFEYS